MRVPEARSVFDVFDLNKLVIRSLIYKKNAHSNPVTGLDRPRWFKEV